MLAVYDLAVSPPTFDFIGFLVSAERQRIRSGEKTITIAIVSGPNGGFRQDDLPPNDPAKRRMMLDNIVKPMATLLPSCTDVIEMSRDEVKERLLTEKRVFPAGYQAEKPRAHYGTAYFVRSSRAKVLPLVIDNVVPEKNLVVITLRQSHYWPTRNSNVAEWLKVAKELTARGKRVVFVPDSDSDGSELAGFDIDRRASTDLLHRCRLAASAELNLSVNNGPLWMLAMMPQVKSMIFKMVAQDAPCVNPDYFRQHELPVGSQLDRADHKIVWADDDADTILKAIDEGFPSAVKSAA
ncbi:MAG: hypothetical protein Q7T44_05115 [Parvibaculum sp.]|nr:hypothetical protein [Parvibaculum sp.]